MPRSVLLVRSTLRAVRCSHSPALPRRLFRCAIYLSTELHSL
jgi:hypothetical protein